MAVVRGPQPPSGDDYQGPQDLGSAFQQTVQGGEGQPGQFLTPLGGYLKHRLGQAISAISRTDPGVGPGIIAGRPVTDYEKALAAFSKAALSGGEASMGVARGLRQGANELRPGVAKAIQDFRKQYVTPGEESMGDVLRVLEASPEGRQWAGMSRAASNEAAAAHRDMPFWPPDLPPAGPEETIPAAPPTRFERPFSHMDPATPLRPIPAALTPFQVQETAGKAAKSNVIPFPKKKDK